MRQAGNTKPPKKDDDYNTPRIAFDLIFKHLNITDQKVWCPFYNNGNLTNILHDYNIIHEDKDFFSYIPNDYFILIDNPPYSTKKQIMERCVEIGKPFALLIPMDTLDRQYTASLMRQGDWSIIIPHKRYKFNDNSVSMPFKVIWLCYKCKLKQQIIFE